jgi:hypothetical protein
VSDYWCSGDYARVTLQLEEIVRRRRRREREGGIGQKGRAGRERERESLCRVCNLTPIM